MIVERLPGGPWGQNAFLISKGAEAVVVDPGGNADLILRRLSELDAQLLGIVNTHGHFDHIGAVQRLSGATNAKFYISRLEVPIMKSSNMLTFIFKIKERIAVPSVFEDLEDAGETLQIGAFEFTCLRTPGHTPGGYCFLLDDHLFTGDTLLRTMPASADLPGGDRDALRASIESLRNLPPGLVLHPGHGHDTTLGEALASLDTREEASR